MLSELNADAANSLSTLMQNYLLNFLLTGNPNSEELPRWKPCQIDETQTIHFDKCVSSAVEEENDGL